MNEFLAAVPTDVIADRGASREAEYSQRGGHVAQASREPRERHGRRHRL